MIQAAFLFFSFAENFTLLFYAYQWVNFIISLYDDKVKRNKKKTK